ncbi:MAG: transposase zinc-binding domain-containing protein [Planctomycetaceae bacterium]
MGSLEASVADCLRQHGDRFLQEYNDSATTQITLQHRKVLTAIQRCRTGELGHVIFECARCHHQHRVTFGSPSSLGCKPTSVSHHSPATPSPRPPRSQSLTCYAARVFVEVTFCPQADSWLRRELPNY